MLGPDYRRTQIWPINQLNDGRSDLLRLSVVPPASNAAAAAAGLLPLHWRPIRCPRAEGLAVVTKVFFHFSLPNRCKTPMPPLLTT